MARLAEPARVPGNWSETVVLRPAGAARFNQGTLLAKFLRSVMEAKSSMEDPKPLAPPYVSYRNFELLLIKAWGSGLPSVFDREGLAPVPEQAHKHLRAALRFLGLMDEDLRPTLLFTRLAEATSVKSRQEVLGEVLKSAYTAIMWLPIGSSSTSRESLDMEIEKQYGTTKETTRKSGGFFIQIARASGAEVNHELVRRMGDAPVLDVPAAPIDREPSPKQAADGENERERDLQSPAPEAANELAAPVPLSNGGGSRTLGQYQFLLDLVDLEEMGEEQLKASLILMKYIRKRETAPALAP